MNMFHSRMLLVRTVQLYGVCARTMVLRGVRPRMLFRRVAQSMAPASLVGASRDWTPEEVVRREIALYRGFARDKKAQRA